MRSNFLRRSAINIKLNQSNYFFQRLPCCSLYRTRTTSTPTYNTPCRTVSTQASSPTAGDIEKLRKILGSSAILTDDLDSFNIDWTKHYQGHSRLVVQPTTVDQISQLLTYCHEHHLAVVPQAGKTGLVGGSVPVHDEIILSLSKLNTIHSLDPISGVLHCQAGCFLQTVMEYAADRNHMVPVDLGSKGSCQLGGVASTNAGGPYYYRYGSLAGNILGLQVVLANGSIVTINGNCLKNNTGYKLHQLFIGAEGTLGVITDIWIHCPRQPRSKQGAFVACDSYQQVLRVMETAKTELGEILAAFEIMDQAIMNIIIEQQPHLQCPINNANKNDLCRSFVLVETHGSSEQHDKEKMDVFLDACHTQQSVTDGVVAQSSSQLANFWTIREAANPAMASTGYTYKYDISLPVAEFQDFIEEMKEHLQSFHVVNGNWGHVLDGNLHFNVCSPGTFTKNNDIVTRLEPFLFERVSHRGGSISAEHGLGQQKNEHMPFIHDRATLDTMQSLKDLLDPKGILNPGKVLPKSYLEWSR
jgi:D-2-hydroxyglutarate dehydrogenase